MVNAIILKSVCDAFSIWNSLKCLLFLVSLGTYFSLFFFSLYMPAYISLSLDVVEDSGFFSFVLV